MRQQGSLLPLILLLGPCLMTVGCVQGIVAYRRETPPASPQTGNAQASGTGIHSRPPYAATIPVDQSVWPNGFAPPNKSTGSAGTHLALHEVVDPIAIADSEEAPLPAQFLDGRIDEPCPPANAPMPTPYPPIRGQFGATSPYPRGQMELPVQPGQISAIESEVVPLPQGTPAENPTAKKPTAEKPTAEKPTDDASPNSEPLITLHVDNLEVAKVLEMVSRQAKILNILVSPGVTGAVTLDLRDKTVDETLRIIATQCRLSVRREKDVIYISTLAESRLVQEDDLPVRVYRLNYVKSTDVEKMVKPLLSAQGKFTASPESEMGLVSDVSAAGTTKDVKAGGNMMAGGEIVVVQDYEQTLKMVDRVITEIDVQPIQVLIEAVIVSVALNKGMELGVNFALLDGAGRALGVAGSGAAINAAAGFTPASVLAAGNTGLLKGGAFDGFSQIDPGLKFGFVDQSTTGFIKALETMGETKVLATPRLLVLNKQRAEIHLGQKLGYSTSTQTQTSTVETVQFQDIGTQLRLRPFVSSDGMVRLEVRPERSSGKIEDGIPQVTVAQVTSNVIVPDGATIVIGGLIESEVTHGWAGTPFLSRLPWIGNLFRETLDDTRKRELIIILTPRIWRPDCPESLNYVGAPHTLGLEKRASQTPAAELRDGPSLYELMVPPPAPIGPMRDPPVSSPPPIPVGKASSPERR